MQPGSLNTIFKDRASPLDKTYELMSVARSCELGIFTDARLM